MVELLGTEIKTDLEDLYGRCEAYIGLIGVCSMYRMYSLPEADSMPSDYLPFEASKCPVVLVPGIYPCLTSYPSCSESFSTAHRPTCLLDLLNRR